MRNISIGRLDGAVAKEATADDRIRRGLDDGCYLSGHLLVTNIKTAGDDLEVLAFDKAVEPQLVEECNKRGRLSCAGDQNAKPIGAAWNLRAELQRRCNRNCRTPEKCDELAPSHCLPPSCRTGHRTAQIITL